jgi:phosphotransferase system HPr-like phosphotransfer protein
MFFLSDFNAEFGRGRDKKKRLRRGDTINAKTYVKGGWFGLGLSKGKPLKIKSTGNDQKDAIKLAKTFYNREKKAGRM